MMPFVISVLTSIIACFILITNWFLCLPLKALGVGWHSRGNPASFRRLVCRPQSQTTPQWVSLRVNNIKNRHTHTHTNHHPRGHSWCDLLLQTVRWRGLVFSILEIGVWFSPRAVWCLSKLYKGNIFLSWAFPDKTELALRSNVGIRISKTKYFFQASNTQSQDSFNKAAIKDDWLSFHTF